jgi:membrane-anchored protein YejM (alkaline phosphatase superfamily)
MSENDPPRASLTPFVTNFDANWLSIARGDLCGEVSLYTGIPGKSISWNSPLWAQQDATRSYRASVAYMDAQVGKLINALKVSGQFNDTLIIMFGDHGFHLG